MVGRVLGGALRIGGDCAKSPDFMLGNCTRSCYNRSWVGCELPNLDILKESKWFLAQGVCNHFGGSIMCLYMFLFI